jgi:hypothetical protein
MDDVRDFFNGWLISHIKGIVLSWAIISVVTAVSHGLYGNAYGASALHKWSVFMDWLWLVDTVFSVVSFINWSIRAVAKFTQQLWEDIKDIFRG